MLLAVIAAEYLAAPRPGSIAALEASLKQELRFTYHDCIPLGWKPVPVHGTYYPGYTASVQNYAEWLDALWRGHIERRELRAPAARDVFNTLNTVVAAGLMTRTADASGFRYTLTPRAFPYYYASSVFRDNRDSLPYLCYTNIVPRRIRWLHETRGEYDVEFAWTPSAAPAWARTPFMRSHSVVLPPVTSPTLAKMRYRNGQWELLNVYDRGWMLPALVTARTRTPR